MTVRATGAFSGEAAHAAGDLVRLLSTGRGGLGMAAVAVSHPTLRAWTGSMILPSCSIVGGGPAGTASTLAFGAVAS